MEEATRITKKIFNSLSKRKSNIVIESNKESKPWITKEQIEENTIISVNIKAEPNILLGENEIIKVTKSKKGYNIELKDKII